MKKYINILLASVLLMGLTLACKKETPVNTDSNKLTVTSAEATFDATGGEGQIIVTAPSTVTASVDKDWISVNVNGTTINLTVSPWTHLESRSALVTISSGSEKTTVSVLQRGITLKMGNLQLIEENILMGSADPYSFPFESESSTVTVSSEYDWLNVEVQDGALVVTPTENTTHTTRHGDFQVTFGDITATIPIGQYPIFEKTPDWVCSFVEKVFDEEGVSTVSFKNTVKADHGKFGLYFTSLSAYKNSKLSEEDYVRDVVYDLLAKDIWEAVAYYNGRYTFGQFLYSKTSTEEWTDVDDGDYMIFAVGMDDEGFPTGWYGAAEVKVGEVTPYERWLGKWNVPRGVTTDTDVWTVEENVVDKSYKVYGFGGFDADDYATGAFIAIVDFDAETEEMVFKVYENMEVTWTDSTRGTMNALLSGNYTNVAGKTYYNSGVGIVICRAKLNEDGTATLTGGQVTSGGAPATFHNIRWYGRYTSSTGSRSAVSWTNTETSIPVTISKGE